MVKGKKLLAILLIILLILIIVSSYIIYVSLSEKCGNGICDFSEEYYENFSSCERDCVNCDDDDECTLDIYNYSIQECIYETLLKCDGNSICETGEYGFSSDCPVCNDNDKCTTDRYDYISERCVYVLLDNCCGNNKCESGENYLNCEDCNKAMILGDLIEEEDYQEVVHFISDDFIRVYKEELEEGRFKITYSEYDLEMHNVILRQMIDFEEETSDFSAWLECIDDFDNKIEARGDFGTDTFFENGVPLFGTDENVLVCEKECNPKTVEDMVMVNKVDEGGEAYFEMQFHFNPDYETHLFCEGVVSSDQPEEEINFDFEINYLK
jgi:hypothetical protein